MRIHAINAFEGDCLLLESNGRFALIDGGPGETFDSHLGEYLQQTIGDSGVLEAVIVSHVDRDHITGVLDLLADLDTRRVDGDPTITIRDLWHNSFARALDNSRGTIFANLQAMMSLAGRAQFAAANGSIALLGIAQGEKLRRQALKLGIPLNGAFNSDLISVDNQTGTPWELGDAKFHVAGPTQANLDELRDEWMRWIADNLDKFADGDTHAMANADKSIPNLSSVVLVGTTADGDVLLTGDARGDHILQGLEQSGELPAGGGRHFRLLKVQHHGSDRNVARDFFERLPADIYLISADGKHGNPDLEVLTMIVDVASDQARSPILVITNQTDTVAQLRQERPDDQFDYTLEVRGADQNAVVVDLAVGGIV